MNHLKISDGEQPKRSDGQKNLDIASTYYYKEAMLSNMVKFYGEIIIYHNFAYMNFFGSTSCPDTAYHILAIGAVDIDHIIIHYGYGMTSSITVITETY